MSDSNNDEATPFMTALIAGGLAGTSVDVALFPIDTVKTRLQSPQGFFKAGGFQGIYRGLGAAAVGSSPGAALFFSTYETLKPRITEFQKTYGIFPNNPSLSHMASASLGEVAACLVRVPTEVVKSKMQTNQAGAQTLSSTVTMVLSETSATGGVTAVWGGLYRGFGVTLMREIPFAFIQFPIYENAKTRWSDYQGSPVNPIQAAACGSFGGGIAAALTTPLDVVKTRLMLGKDNHGVSYKGGLDVIRRVRLEEGPGMFLSGIQPRVMWISIGGFVFFGAYETYKSLLIPF
mmetsp:Transcript_32681/g.47966  ORF Transcript_32681/g.47966 Transcript_32681/m.47966 type:complete len:291 (-) Transcript_32681:680-1552(-)